MEERAVGALASRKSRKIFLSEGGWRLLSCGDSDDKIWISFGWDVFAAPNVGRASLRMETSGGNTRP